MAKPTIDLKRWRVLRVKARGLAAHTFHAIGYSETADSPWVSDPVKTYDPDTKTITTTSGEIIRLHGLHGGYSRTVDTYWARWCEKRRLTEIVDVSSRYVPAQRKRRRAPQTPGQNTAKA